MSTPVSIFAGDLSLELRPDLGGAVTGFRASLPTGAFDLLRPFRIPDGGVPHALYSSMFPMVPFANCIRDNRFRWEGIDYSVTPNMAGVRLNYHGAGWQLPWRVAQQDHSHVDLVLDDARVDNAFQFSARQSFKLSVDALAVDLTVSNKGDRTMPFSCGLHPWFPRHNKAQVKFTAGQYWVEDGDGHAVSLATPHHTLNFDDWKSPPRSFQNKCFVGWDGVAEVFWPDFEVFLRIVGDPNLGHLMFHVPQDSADIFCLEPQTNAPCAFDGIESGVVNEGVHLLSPGEECSVSVRFEVRTGMPFGRL